MIHQGTKPVRPDHRNYSFNRTFGDTVQLPDEYNVDSGFGFPDQNADGLPYGCTGYTQSELCQDQDGTPYKPPYTYDKTLFMEGAEGQQVGCSITDSLKSTIVYGVQGAEETTDEQAGTHRRGQYFQIEPVGTDMFDAIRQALYLNSAEKSAVSVGTPWFHEWESPLGGIVSDFIFTGNEPWHNWKICGWKLIGGQPYLIGKSWQGPNWGDRGYHYVSREICNKAFDLSGTAAFTVRKATAADIQTVRLDIFDTILSYLRMWIVNLFPLPAQNAPVSLPTASSTPNSTVPVQVPSTVPESVPAPSMLDTFCTAIRDYEGVPGDLNYQLNNPGDCRPSPVGYLPKYAPVVIIDTDTNPAYPFHKGSFAKFPTYALGWEYLENLVHYRAELHAEWTILDFFSNYAPAADANAPANYAKFVAERCNAGVDTTLAQLFA